MSRARSRFWMGANSAHTDAGHPEDPLHDEEPHEQLADVRGDERDDRRQRGPQRVHAHHPPTPQPRPRAAFTNGDIKVSRSSARVSRAT